MPAFQKVRVAVSTKSVVVNMDNDLWKKDSFADESVDVTHLGGRSMILKKAFSANGSGYLNLIYGALQNTSSNTTKKIASMIEKGEAEFVCESKFPVQTGKSPIPVYKSKASVKGKNAEMFVEIVEKDGKDKVVFHCNVLPFGEASEFKDWCGRLRTFYANTDTEKGAREEAEKARKEAAEKKAREEAEEKARKEAEAKARKEAEAKARKEAEEKARKEAEAEAAAQEARLRKQEKDHHARFEAAKKEALGKLQNETILFLRGGGGANPMQTQYSDTFGARVVKCDEGLIFYPSLNRIRNTEEGLQIYAHEVYTLSQAVAGNLGDFKKFSEAELTEKERKMVTDTCEHFARTDSEPMSWEEFKVKSTDFRGRPKNEQLIKKYAEKLETAK